MRRLSDTVDLHRMCTHLTLDEGLTDFSAVLDYPYPFSRYHHESLAMEAQVALEVQVVALEDT